MSGEWVKRGYVPEDENGVFYLWLKSSAHAKHAKRERAHHDTSPEELAFFREMRPIVEMLLRDATTEVICDPDRASYEPGKPAVIWAFACTSGDVVHQVVVKRSVVETMGAGFVGDLVRDLLGDRLAKTCWFTWPVKDLYTGKWGVRVPTGETGKPLWHADPGWLARHIFMRADRAWLDDVVRRTREAA